MNLPPLSLYIHIPWCVKKCPYCDFNSHAVKGTLPEQEYLAALIADLKLDLEYVQQRTINTIFFGGGTPSLISPLGIENLLKEISALVTFAPDIEITLETNPGTAEHFNLHDYKQAGINRISLGAQSFNDKKLQALGRIHAAKDTLKVIDKLHAINFKSFNIDIMHGLPQQSFEEAMQDLDTALACDPPHFSWYQLTIEPNTLFFKYPPKLPEDDITWEIQIRGEEKLAAAGFEHYEVSAFAQPKQECRHNVNYWEFGDYIGIGAGAHGKITDMDGSITRMWKTRYPKDYLDPNKKFLAGSNVIPASQLPSEYMLNRLRLFDKLNLQHYQQRTNLPISSIAAILETARKKELITIDGEWLAVTLLGKRFLNDLIQLFLVQEVENA